MNKYLVLYSTFFLYSIVAVLEKVVSGYSFFSKEFIILYSIEILFLFLYAVIWQRVLKRFSLSIAYINKGSVFIFNAIWASFLFKESFSLKEVIAVIIIIIGIIILNRGDE